MEWLTAWFASVWNSFERWGKSLLLTVWDMITDGFLAILDLLSELVTALMDGAGTMYSDMDMLPFLSFIPPDVSNVMGLIGLGQAMTIIITAIGIRLVLQLIPFVRLGS